MARGCKTVCYQHTAIRRSQKLGRVFHRCSGCPAGQLPALLVQLGPYREEGHFCLPVTAVIFSNCSGVPPTPTPASASSSLGGATGRWGGDQHGRARGMLCTTPCPGGGGGLASGVSWPWQRGSPGVPSPQDPHVRSPWLQGIEVSPGTQGSRAELLACFEPRAAGTCQAELAQPHLCSGRIFGLCADFAVCFYLAAGIAFSA